MLWAVACLVCVPIPPSFHKNNTTTFILTEFAGGKGGRDFQKEKLFFSELSFQYVCVEVDKLEFGRRRFCPQKNFLCLSACTKKKKKKACVFIRVKKIRAERSEAEMRENARDQKKKVFFPRFFFASRKCASFGQEIFEINM